MDLVALQENTGQIRNPFQFDFVITWNKKPIVLKGDGKWRTVIGPLRDHIARHLFMKIRYQYHDEQVNKLKDAGRDRDARKYNVPAQVENKIWMLITGDQFPGKEGRDPSTVVVENELADLAELKSGLSALDKQAAGGTGPVNISALIDKANVEAGAAGSKLNVGESQHKSGMGTVDGREVPKTSTDTKPVLAEELAPTSPANDSVLPAEETSTTPANEGDTVVPEGDGQDHDVRTADAAPQGGEFEDVQELDAND